MALPKVYFLSGLGADERAFAKLRLPGFQAEHIKWVKPLENESLHDYSLRLSEQITDKDHLRLVGMSFGGIVAQEMAGFLPCEKLILLSSIKSPDEMDWRYNLVRKTGLYKNVPISLIKKMNDLTANHFFGVQSPEEEKLLRIIIHDSDEDFVNWAVQKIIEWKGPPPNLQLLQIHGTADRIFPASSIKGATWIEGGSHFMVYSKAEEVSAVIVEYLS